MMTQHHLLEDWTVQQQQQHCQNLSSDFISIFFYDYLLRSRIQFLISENNNYVN